MIAAADHFGAEWVQPKRTVTQEMPPRCTKQPGTLKGFGQIKDGCLHACLTGTPEEVAAHVGFSWITDNENALHGADDCSRFVIQALPWSAGCAVTT